MGIRDKRLLVISIDQAIPYLVNKFTNKGIIPKILREKYYMKSLNNQLFKLIILNKRLSKKQVCFCFS